MELLLCLFCPFTFFFWGSKMLFILLFEKPFKKFKLFFAIVKDIQYLVFVVFIQQGDILSKIINYELIEMKQAFLVNDFFTPYPFEYSWISTVAVCYYHYLFLWIKMLSQESFDSSIVFIVKQFISDWLLGYVI